MIATINDEIGSKLLRNLKLANFISTDFFAISQLRNQTNCYGFYKTILFYVR